MNILSYFNHLFSRYRRVDKKYSVYFVIKVISGITEEKFVKIYWHEEVVTAKFKKEAFLTAENRLKNMLKPTISCSYELTCLSIEFLSVIN